MKIEQQVCSLEQAKKLKELGAKQNKSVIYWFVQERVLGMGERINLCYHTDATYREQYAAFTVAELGMMLPNGYDTMQITEHPSNLWVGFNLMGDEIARESTEAQARAEMIIHLIENSLITIEEINSRI